jgi:Na+/H+-dicarboxylate symporter
MPTRKFYVTLAATRSAFPAIPVAGLTVLVGVDRFMSEARSVTNLIGNAVATMVIARWDGALDLERARRVLDGLEGLEGQEEQEGQELREGLVIPHPPSGHRSAEAAHR